VQTLNWDDDDDDFEGLSMEDLQAIESVERSQPSDRKRPTPSPIDDLEDDALMELERIEHQAKRQFLEPPKVVVPPRPAVAVRVPPIQKQPKTTTTLPEVQKQNLNFLKNAMKIQKY